MSRDCNVTSDDADNPNIKCTRKKHEKETCRFIRWVMTTSERNGNVMPSIPAHYEGKQSSKSRSKSTPDDWCRLISQNHIMPALLCLIMTLVAIELEGVLGACPFEVLCINSFSLDY